MTFARQTVNWLKTPAHAIMTAFSLIPVIVLAGFLLRYGNAPFPYSDGYGVNAEIVLRMKQGVFDPTWLIVPFNGHRIFFTKLSAFLVASVSEWSPRTEVWINFALGLLNAVLMTIYAARIHPKIVHWLMLPIFILILSVDYGLTWLVGLMSQWHYVLTFCLLSLLMLVTIKRDAVAVGWSIFFGICATMSSGTGILVWIMIFLAMFTRGVRHWSLYLLIIGLTLADLWITSTTSVSNLSNSGMSLPPLSETISFNLLYLGRPLVHREAGTLARWLAVLGIAVLIVNTIIYWRVTGSVRKLLYWLPWMAHGVMAGIIYTVSRYEYLGGMFVATVERYMMTSFVVWLAFFVVVIVVTAEVSQKLSGWQRAVTVLFNGLTAGTIAVIYFYSLITHGALNLDYDIPVSRIQDITPCIEAFPLSRDATCAGNIHIDAGKFDDMAAWRVGGFAVKPADMILPESYTLDDGIVINTGEIWNNVQIHLWWLDGVPAEGIMHIAPISTDDPTAEDEVALLPDPITHRIVDTSADSIAALNDYYAGKSSVWVITNMQTRLNGFDYTANGDFQVVTSYALDYDHALSHYLRKTPPELEQDQLTFAETIQLQVWQLFPKNPLQRCDEVAFQGWWLFDALPDLPENGEIRVTLALLTADWSTGITSTDSPIVPYLSDGLPVGETVVDERFITIPCDVPPGDYILALGLYRFDRGEQRIVEDLPITSLDSEEFRIVLQSFSLP